MSSVNLTLAQLLVPDQPFWVFQELISWDFPTGQSVEMVQAEKNKQKTLASVLQTKIPDWIDAKLYIRGERKSISEFIKRKADRL